MYFSQLERSLRNPQQGYPWCTDARRMHSLQTHDKIKVIFTQTKTVRT